MRCAAGALFVVLLACGAAHAAGPSVAVGIIAPLTGRSSGAGFAHKKSTEWGLGVHHYSVRGPSGWVTIRLVERDDRSNEDEAARAAEELVREEGVIAIVGPVNSSSTAAVLQKKLEVPVVSPLSTAIDLTSPRDPWFFRATIDDHERMGRYAEFIDRQKLRQGRAVLVYEDDTYGRGLAEALWKHLKERGEVLRKTWGELGADGTDEGWKRLADGVGFSDAVLSELPKGPLDVFVLGTNKGSTAIGQGLDRRLRVSQRAAVQFFFVGEPRFFLEGAPEGSITIGEPSLDDVPEQFLPDASTVRVLNRDREGFLVTSFEVACFVLPAAIKQVLAGGTRPEDAKEFREGLRKVLEEHTFDSLVPWRKIKLSNGRLEELPTTPVFQLKRTPKRLDRVEPPPFLVLRIPARARFFAEPVRVSVERFAVAGDGMRFVVAGNDTIKMQVLNEHEDVVAEEQVPLAGGKGTFVYYPRGTGQYRLRTSAAQLPGDASFEVRWTFDFPLAVIGAIVGLLLGMGRPSSLRLPWRVAAGVLTGLVLFVISSWGRDSALASIVPLPSFHAIPWFNAFLIGLVGGWGGLELLLRIVQAITGVSPTQRS